MLHIESLAVSYGRAKVLFDVNLRVEQGEIVTLLGGNGVGKTTTLKAISGLVKPRSGSIMFPEPFSKSAEVLSIKIFSKFKSSSFLD